MRSTKEKRGITRRTFLEATGGIGAVSVVGATGAFEGSKAFASTQQPAASQEQGEIRYVNHQTHCQGKCMLKCTVRDGRLVKVEPNDTIDNDYCRTVCLKGISEVQHVYSDKRIKTPLRRTGERGSGEFEPISWDEALDELVGNLKSTWDKHGKDAVFVSTCGESQFISLPAMLGATTAENGIDIGVGNGLDPMYGGIGYGFQAANDKRDLANARTMLIVGSNLAESGLVHNRAMLEAQEAGMKLIVVDPQFSTTAGKADQWVPIKPGTDDALFLGMADAIISNNWHDENFMLQKTSFPFLLDTATGKLLTQGSKTGPEDPMTGEPTEIPLYLVWDTETNAAVPFDSATSPALEGTFTVNGTACQTVFSAFKNHLTTYNIAWAAQTTDIPAETITDLAKRYATAGPSVLALGFGGNDKYSNGDIGGHAAGMVVALTGNIGKAGGGVGVMCGDGGASATLATWKLPANMKAAEAALSSFDYSTTPNNIHMWIGVGDTAQQHFANYSQTMEWLKSLDYVVFIDMYRCSSYDYADLILPICSKFESEEEVSGIRSARGHVSISQKVIDPLYESKSEFALQKELARRLGCEDALPASMEEYVRYQLEQSTDPALAGITYEKLLANGCALPIAGAETPVIAFEGQVFDTPTTRLEVYYEDQLESGQALPTHEDPCEVGDSNPLRSTYPLQLMQLRTRFRTHNMYYDAQWNNQFSEPCIEMNPADMDARGLSNGDKVRAFNDRGSFSTIVRPNESIRPGTARTFEGMWTEDALEGNLQMVTNNSVSERGRGLMAGPVIPFNDTLVEIAKA